MRSHSRLVETISANHTYYAMGGGWPLPKHARRQLPRMCPCRWSKTGAAQHTLNSPRLLLFCAHLGVTAIGRQSCFALAVDDRVVPEETPMVAEAYTRACKMQHPSVTQPSGCLVISGPTFFVKIKAYASSFRFIASTTSA